MLTFVQKKESGLYHQLDKLLQKEMSRLKIHCERANDKWHAAMEAFGLMRNDLSPYVENKHTNIQTNFDAYFERVIHCENKLKHAQEKYRRMRDNQVAYFA